MADAIVITDGKKTPEIHSQEEELAMILATLTDIQLRFLAARLGVASDKEAAAAIDVSSATVYSWPEKPAIKRAVILAQLGVLDVVRERMTRLAIMAMEVLEDEMGQRTGGGQNRLRAALEVLDRAGLSAMRRSQQQVDVTTAGQPLQPHTTKIIVREFLKGNGDE